MDRPFTVTDFLRASCVSTWRYSSRLACFWGLCCSSLAVADEPIFTPAFQTIPQEYSASTDTVTVSLLQPEPIQAPPATTNPLVPAPQPQTTSPDLFPQYQPRLPLLGELPIPPDLASPKPSAETQAKFQKHIVSEISPENEMMLVMGRPKILILRNTPLRTYIPAQGAEIIALRPIDEAGQQMAVEPLREGSTVLTIWMPDPESPDGMQVLSYLVRVIRDPELLGAFERRYKRLEEEINRNFPNSVIRLSMIGEKLVVRGQAHDIEEATRILDILAANAPGGPEPNPLRIERQRLERLDAQSQTNDVISTSPYSDVTNLLSTLQTEEEFSVSVDSSIVNMLTIPGEQQVCLKIQVAEVNRNALRRWGANMRLDTGDFGLSSLFPAQNVIENLLTGELALSGGTLAVASSDFEMTLNALRQLGVAKTLAEPNLVTLNGRPATFRAGDTFPVPIALSNNGGTAQGVQQEFVGIRVSFTPTITDKTRIRLSLNGTASTRDDSQGTSVGNSNVPGTQTRNFQTTVELREGESLALAGLIQSSQGSNGSRVPGIGDLPGVGRLFASDDTSASEFELLILVTPTIVRPLNEGERYPLPGEEILDPDDIEFFLQGRLEGTGRNGYRSPVMTDWSRIRTYRGYDTKVIIGPSGYSTP